MCGIAGIHDPQSPPDAALLDRMAAPLVKRGPDQGNTYRQGPLGLVHRRLSIIDLSEAGRQPLYNEDRSLAIIVNGEIYDFQAIRQRLQANGHRFTSGSDSEVLLHLYEERGPDMLQELNGMFALCIADLRSGDLFLARDRLGQKPLFYARQGDRFAFASGPASLACLPWVDTQPDAQAIHHYLELQYIHAPASIYRGIRKLPPGHYATWKGGQLTIEPYWRPTIHGSYPGTYQDACADLRDALTGAVKRRLVADVPVGIFLSGGMDSSLMCALGQQLSSRPIQTFSIGFPERKYDERDYAETVANHLGTEHHFLEVVPHDFSRLEQIVNDCEEPFADASILPTWLLSEFTRRQVTVSLSGDAADELFGGYYRYAVMYKLRHLDRIPGGIRSLARSGLLAVLPPKREERTFWGRIRRLTDVSGCSGIERYLRIISRCPSPFKQTLYGDAMRGNHRSTLDLLQSYHRGDVYRTAVDAIAELDLATYLPDDILVKVDRASMAHALEVRSPFLDPGVVDLAAAFPFDWKQRGTARKRILRDTFGSLLPDEIFTRRKMGFGVPIARWFRDQWHDPAADLLLGGRLVQHNWLDGPALQSLWDTHQAQHADHSYTLFALLVLELWHRQNQA